MAGIVGITEAAVGLFMAVALVAGVYHKYVVDPAIQQAEDAMATARKAKQTANAAEETAEDVGERVDKKLDHIDDTLESIKESQSEQARESRVRSWYLRQITEAIRQTDGVESDKLPEIEEDDFLRGGGGVEEWGDD